LFVTVAAVSFAGRRSTEVTEVAEVKVADGEAETLRLPPLLLFDSVDGRRPMEVVEVTEVWEVTELASGSAETVPLRLPSLLLVSASR
jgi:hypothetical protein